MSGVLLHTVLDIAAWLAAGAVGVVLIRLGMRGPKTGTGA
jgi:hypothetical protein